MRTTRFLAIAFAFAFFVGARAAAADLPALRIVTPQYTLQCDTARVHGNMLELTCVPQKRAQPDAFDRFQYGTALPRALFTQYYGNGGPALCDGTAITCSTGVVTLNTANANSWSATQTFSGVIDSALSASDLCVASDGSKNLIDGSCLTTAGGQTITAAETLSGGATFGAPLNLSSVAMSTTTGPGLYADASGGLHITATAGQSISFPNKLSVSIGLGMNGYSVTAIGHMGSYFACTATGTATLTTSSSDSFCLITLASSTATITFKNAMTGTSAPICEGTDETAAGPVKIAPSGSSGNWTGYVITAGTGVGASDVIAVHCIANGGA